MTPYLSRMSGIRVIPNSATAASESCSGIRHRLMSRCERSLVGRGASIRCDFNAFIFRKAIAPGQDQEPRHDDSLEGPSLSNRLKTKCRTKKYGSGSVPGEAGVLLL